MLCAQHALNNLCQGPFFTAQDLAVIAGDLDRKEADQLDPKDENSTPQESANYDDTGFFSLSGRYNAVVGPPRSRVSARSRSVALSAQSCAGVGHGRGLRHALVFKRTRADSIR